MWAARKRSKVDPTNLIRFSLRRRLLLAMLAVTALGFILTGAATLKHINDRMLYAARATETRWRCPPEMVIPRSPISVASD